MLEFLVKQLLNWQSHTTQPGRNSCPRLQFWLGFQFGLYHVVFSVSFLFSISLASLFSNLFILGFGASCAGYVMTEYKLLLSLLQLQTLCKQNNWCPNFQISRKVKKMSTDLRRPSGNWKLILNIEFIFRSEGSILNTRARYLDLLAQKQRN